MCGPAEDDLIKCPNCGKWIDMPYDKHKCKGKKEGADEHSVR